MNNIIDFLFFIDIVLTFNTATHDEDFEVITDRKAIAWEYVTGWFFLDFICIVPFAYMFPNGNSTNVARLARIGRINKILKLLKMIRLSKMSKKSSRGFLGLIIDSM